jgi:membrane-associated phospholipid phosphatase
MLSQCRVTTTVFKDMTLPAARFSSQHAAVWALSCLVLTGLCILFLDRPIATWSHDALHRPAAAVAITKLANVQIVDVAALAVPVIALILRLANGRLSPPWRTATSACLAILLATVLVILLKYAFGRLWPDTWVNNNPSWIGSHAYGFAPFHGGRGWASFPSGHTARTSAPFAVLWQRLPRFRVLWVLPTLIIAAALIACNFHFLGDCVAGVYVGIASAAAVMLVV